MDTSNREFEEALRALNAGPSALTPDDKRALDDAGYVVFRSAIDPAWLAALRADCDAWRPGEDGNGGQGGNLQINRLHADRSPALRAILWPKLLAAAFHILGRPFSPKLMGWRSPRRGLGQQALHTDWAMQGDPSAFHVVTSLWILDDFTPDNGPTRVVPGSHKQRRPVPKHYADPATRHQGEVTIEAKAGSVLVFNGHLWHSGTRNQSGAPRRVLQCGFHAQEHTTFAPPAVIEQADRLPDAARRVLGLSEALPEHR